MLKKVQTDFTSLADETRPAVDTNTAAHFLNRKSNTLRTWAMTGKVITPIRVNGRLAWPVAEIRRVLGVTA
jgi:predicted site-specific integrase-resolvase